MPNINPIPEPMSHKGATMFTAASAELPIPCPTNIPSEMVITILNTELISVGISILLKRIPVFSFSKSIASLCMSFENSYEAFKCKVSEQYDYQFGTKNKQNTECKVE